MNEGERLLQAILRDPGDTALRLVYADWLEEQGQEWRARMARKDERWMFGKPESLSDWWLVGGAALPAGELLGLFRACRATLVPAHAESKVVFRGGLIEGVRCSVADWLACGKRICASHPVLSLELHDFAPGPADEGVSVRVLDGRNNQGLRHDRCWIPDRWGRRLAGGRRMHRLPSLRDRRYSTAYEAVTDVHQAALAWAKERRGRKAFPGRDA